jgi:hypothetical protein
VAKSVRIRYRAPFSLANGITAALQNEIHGASETSGMTTSVSCPETGTAVALDTYRPGEIL